MNKISENLENSIKDLMTQEADSIDADALWNKIEAALPEKVADKNEATIISKENPDANGQATDTSKKVIPFEKTPWYKNPRVLSTIGTIAAACIIGLVAIRGNLINRSYSPMFSDSAPAEEAAEATNESYLESLAPAATEEMPTLEGFDSPSEYEANKGIANDMPEYSINNTEESEEPSSDKENSLDNSSREKEDEEKIVVHISFEIVDETDDYFVGRVLDTNSYMEKEEEFYLEKNAELGLNASFEEDLLLVREEDEKKIFKIFK